MWFILCAGVLFLMYKFLIYPQLYWRRKNVPQDFPIPIVGDSIWMVFGKQTLLDFLQSMYWKRPDIRYYGIYRMTTPCLLVRDPDLIKQITVKDFDYFTDHQDFFLDGYDPILDNNLFSLKGQHWRQLRTTVSPVFTMSKVRVLFDLSQECAERFVKFHLDVDEDVISIEAKDRFSRYTNDTIATCAFGVECNSLAEPDNEFYASGIDITSATGFIRSLKYLLAYCSPTVLKICRLKILSEKSRNFLITIVDEAISSRGKEKNITRPDMIQVMMDAKKVTTKMEELTTSGQDDWITTTKYNEITKIKPITDSDIVSQALIFFFAGFETTSTLMAFMAYELALHPKIQEKLQEEVQIFNENCEGTINYETLNSMKYLDMVIRETLRKWPPVRYMDRICTKPYTIDPIRPGEKPVHLKMGDSIIIPTSALHFDETYYENPKVFDPERFSAENKRNFNPYTYLPFGVGPRHCIGYRFVLMTTKIMFFHLLKSFDIVAVDKTRVPLKIGYSLLNLNVIGGIQVGLRKRVNSGG